MMRMSTETARQILYDVDANAAADARMRMRMLMLTTDDDAEEDGDDDGDDGNDVGADADADVAADVEADAEGDGEDYDDDDDGVGDGDDDAVAMLVMLVVVAEVVMGIVTMPLTMRKKPWAFGSILASSFTEVATKRRFATLFGLPHWISSPTNPSTPFRHLRAALDRCLYCATMVRTGDKQGPKRSIRNGTRVLVRDLPDKVRKTSLQSAFGDFGNVVRIDLNLDQRTAYIEYEEPQDAEDAAREMDGKLIEKSKVRTKIMDDRPRGPMDHAIRVQEAQLAHLENRAAEHQQRIFGADQSTQPRRESDRGRSRSRSRRRSRR
eukprot:s388_g9.t2